MVCSAIEHMLIRRSIYSFDPLERHLPCLAHVLNLAIVDFMSILTNIGAIEMSTAIWEFDPMLLANCVLGGSLDAISAIRTIAIKVCIVF
jgi:hypothetical protein